MNFNECCEFFLQNQSEGKKTFLTIEIFKREYLVELTYCEISDRPDEDGNPVYLYLGTNLLAKSYGNLIYNHKNIFTITQKDYSQYRVSLSDAYDILLYISSCLTQHGELLLKNLCENKL